jgi:hypothetical protein
LGRGLSTSPVVSDDASYVTGQVIFVDGDASVGL